jgi:hypothetical protein
MLDYLTTEWERQNAADSLHGDSTQLPAFAIFSSGAGARKFETHGGFHFN